MVMVMMVVVTNSDHNLGLRRDRSHEAEGENQSNQKLLHMYIDATYRRQAVWWIAYSVSKLPGFTGI